MKRTLVAWILAIHAVAPLLLTVTRQWPHLVNVRSGETLDSESVSGVLSQNFNPFSDSDVRIDIPTMAALAANVYQPAGVYDPTCSPDRQGRIPVDGWEQLTEGWSYPAACNAALSGLYYEVWLKMDREGRSYVAIVFRGTIPTIAHWCSNLRDARLPICDPKSDQYLYMAPLINDVLTGQYDEWGPDRYTILVGHSLGGGLAELAARSSYVKQVFGFNSSPVVGRDAAEILSEAFGDVDALGSVGSEFQAVTGCPFDPLIAPESRRLVIRRIYEHGEALAYVRLLKRWIQGSPVDDATAIEYRMNLLAGGMVYQHGIKAFACAMRNRLTEVSR